MPGCKRAGIARMRVAFLLLILSGCCCGWLFRKKDKSHNCAKKRSPDEKPYFFGTTNLFCMTYSYYFRRPKRTARMPTLKPIHSWIQYDGHYVEFGIYHNYSKPYNYSVSIERPAVGDKCNYRLQQTPKGYSSLGIDCIKGCARNYMRKYGKYRLFLNNCHVFINRISKILCHSTSCPSWCLFNQTATNGIG
ncbi:uncharacterized protein LOC110448862 isoform X2 [Mizuhopecten yessoensis]|uniref:Uncharacterized protein n=1 Tax=Mizuhopecten yessoensis TaxID=6573 RepID=A0A210QSH2_MIZYE|nr:uncharacterized protein LOC110448862 isoform X2 [Mizuhopecten yessoensis]OWF51648.1 hypothetical protein KP79_PYT11711 [Mizuhopecten yessoensis]